MPVYGKPLSSAIFASEFIPLEDRYEIRELRCSYTLWDCREKKLKVMSQYFSTCDLAMHQVNIDADLLSPESIGRSMQFDITAGDVNWYSLVSPKFVPGCWLGGQELFMTTEAMSGFGSTSVSRQVHKPYLLLF